MSDEIKKNFSANMNNEEEFYNKVDEDSNPYLDIQNLQINIVKYAGDTESRLQRSFIYGNNPKKNP